MRIDRYGNVGIGVTPGFRLDVGGRARIRQAPSGESAGIWLYQNGPAADRAFVGMVDDNQVGFWGNAGLGWGLTMNVSSGNVGIGASSPAQRLEVGGSVKASDAFFAGSRKVADGAGTYYAWARRPGSGVGCRGSGCGDRRSRKRGEAQ